MKCFQCVFLILCIIALLSCTNTANERLQANVDRKNDKPNFLLIMVDDLGFDDLSVHGNPHIKTPNLDHFAKASVQFRDFYVSPVCATSRASLLTGRQFYKTGVSGVHGGRDFIRLEETLISEMLKENGYTTGMWGKWHSGKTAGYFPWDRGFDEAYYAELYVHENSHGWLNGKPVSHNKWASEVVADYAIDFMERNKSTPFFSYVSFLAPHGPWDSPEAYAKRFKSRGLSEGVGQLYGMVEEMDHHVGRLLQYLETSGLAENTVVMFFSDNGPWWGSWGYPRMTDKEWADRNPHNYNGWKARNWENGVKSPMFVRWKGVYENAFIDRFADISDIVPTILDMSRTTRPKNSLPLDGHSFKPFLDGDLTHHAERTAFIGTHDVVSDKPHFNQWTPVDEVAKANMNFESQLIALRNERFKLILNPIRDKPHYPEPVNQYVLIDMENDPYETRNVINQYPAEAGFLKKELRRHYDEIVNQKGSFATPVYRVGKSDDAISIVNLFGPASTGGNVKSRSHILGGFVEKGDFAEYTLSVKKGGQYKMYFLQKEVEAKGIEFSISLNDKKINFKSNGSKEQLVKAISLEEGPVKMRLSVIDNPEKQPLSSMYRMIFIDASSTRVPSDANHPI